ncbi:hypothetical protein V1508DRAFT_435357 [Lipomyces doorenjongii]|uniref:uncharacterized protein n=1 Tax=Lipomyces doorenjongii TaxID=383834 RepID=UPI0034CE1363
MATHYKGFNFSPKATVVRSSGNNTYGSKRSGGPNALFGVPYQGDGFDNSYAISFSSELTAAFTIQGFYITVFNISNPTVPPSQSATLVLTFFGANDSFVYYAPSSVSIAIPAGEEMYKISSLFNDSSEAGLIADGLEIERPYYPKLTHNCCEGLGILTFDDIDTSCGGGDIAAPATYRNFRLRYPTSPYEEPSPWNVTAASLYAANSSEALVAAGSRNILYGTTGTNGPSQEPEPLFGVYSIYLDEIQTLKSAADFDFDLVGLRLGLDEIETVPSANGFDKCGNLVAQMTRFYVPFPGTGGSVSKLSAGMLTECNFVGLSLANSISIDTYPFSKYNLPFWISAVEYRRSDLENSCPK